MFLFEQVLLVEFDSVPEQQPAEFIFERQLLVMLFLVSNVASNIVRVRPADGERTESALAGKWPLQVKRLVEPF